MRGSQMHARSLPVVAQPDLWQRYSKARGREKQRFANMESKREKENEGVDPKH